MNSFKLLVTFLVVAIETAPASFIFDADGCESVTLMNHKYDDKCLRNGTVMQKVNEFKTKYDKIKRLTHSEVKFVRRRGFRTSITDICDVKRDIARGLTDWIQPIADFCVGDEKIRKEFVLNTLLLFDATVDFVCGMNQNHFEDIYELHAEHCITLSMQLLKGCQVKSFDLYFWESVPEKLPTTLLLMNGGICNFNYEKMLNCSNDVVMGSTASSCSIGAVELLAYQLDVIKRNSICFKTKDVSEITDSSSEDSSNVVT